MGFFFIRQLIGLTSGIASIHTGTTTGFQKRFFKSHKYVFSFSEYTNSQFLLSLIDLTGIVNNAKL